MASGVPDFAKRSGVDPGYEGRHRRTWGSLRRRLKRVDRQQSDAIIFDESRD
jgi:hypothetical protein